MTTNPLPELGSTKRFTPLQPEPHAGQDVTVVRHMTANVTLVRTSDGTPLYALNRELSS